MTTWCDASTAVQVVESGNNVFLGGFVVTPTPLIQALVARGEELRNVEQVRQCKSSSQETTYFWGGLS